MKTSIKTIIFAAAAIFAAVSCQKESAVSESQAGETIQVNITASIGDLTATDATKAAAEQVVRIKWEAGDIVQAYCGTTKISGEAGLTVTPSENGMFASLTGTITPPNNGQTITFVYSNYEVSEDNPLDFDFFNQTKEQGIPFVAYATLEYEGGDSIENEMVGFKLATSAMKIVAMDLGGGSISYASIHGINTKITLVPSESGDPVITASEPANISTNNVDASSDGTRAIITVGLVPDSNKARSIAVYQTEYTNKGALTSLEIEGNSSYTTPTSLFPCGKITNAEDGTSHDYVLIAGTKWATQNLAASESGHKTWDGTLCDKGPVYLPGGSVTPVEIGDYFQWAAYENYVEPHTFSDDSSDKGLLIYNYFNHKCAEEGSWGASTAYFKDVPDTNPAVQYHFDRDYYAAPYFDQSSKTFIKYTEGEETLSLSDDAARLCWGSTWRMPTIDEFREMKAATYWALDVKDQGYYVYAPQPGHAGNNENKGTYDKASALLFFPIPGYGAGPYLRSYEDIAFESEMWGQYWSSTSGGGEWASIMLLKRDGVTFTDAKRDLGFSIRPVSD